MILGARRSRVVAGIWALVGLGFLAAGVILWVDARRVSFELPAALLAFVLAAAWWRQRAVLDRHGINTVHAFRERRLLWAGIDHVAVDRPGWFRPALVLYPKGGRERITVPASAGLNRRQRNRLLELLTDLSHQHGFRLITQAGVEVGVDPGLPEPAGTYRTVPRGASRDADGAAAMFGDPRVDEVIDVDGSGSAELDQAELDQAEHGQVEQGQADAPGTPDAPDHEAVELDPGAEPVTGTSSPREDEPADQPEDATTAADPPWLAVLEPRSPADERAGGDGSARF